MMPTRCGRDGQEGPGRASAGTGGARDGQGGPAPVVPGMVLSCKLRILYAGVLCTPDTDLGCWDGAAQEGPEMAVLLPPVVSVMARTAWKGQDDPGGQDGPSLATGGGLGWRDGPAGIEECQFIIPAVPDGLNIRVGQRGYLRLQGISHIPGRPC